LLQERLLEVALVQVSVVLAVSALTVQQMVRQAALVK
jgi:hypothetical protein